MTSVVLAADALRRARARTARAALMMQEGRFKLAASLLAETSSILDQQLGEMSDDTRQCRAIRDAVWPDLVLPPTGPASRPEITSNANVIPLRPRRGTT